MASVAVGDMNSWLTVGDVLCTDVSHSKNDLILMAFVAYVDFTVNIDYYVVAIVAAIVWYWRGSVPVTGWENNESEQNKTKQRQRNARKV